MDEIRKIVLPGEFIGKRNGRKISDGVFVEGEDVFAKFVGIPKIVENEISVIPLSGVYLPKPGDKVIGKIIEVEISGWLVDINSPYMAFMSIGEAVRGYVDMTTDLTKFYDVGDVIYCKIIQVTKSKIVRVSMKYLYAKKLFGGVMIAITPSKIPRLVGKGGSMINLIKRLTKCQIIPGQNGTIWIKGVDVTKAVEAILKVEEESHTIGLTEKIEKMLSGYGKEA